MYNVKPNSEFDIPDAQLLVAKYLTPCMRF